MFGEPTPTIGCMALGGAAGAVGSGEITVEEYVHLYAQMDTVAGRHSSLPPHH